MAKLKLTSEIVDKDAKVWLSWDGFDRISSDDVVKFIDSIPADDNKIDIHINCPGGYCFEGLRMYDALRQSGKEISCIVEGLCASMATIILMAAPKERRLAYPNATFLIHNPEAGFIKTGGYPDRLTADELENMSEKMRLQADELRDLQNRLIDIYVDRTGTDRETLQSLMDDDITIGASRAIELGLISETLAPNTASTKNNFNMAKKDNKTEVNENWLQRLIAKAGFKSREAVTFKDLTFTAVDGSEFTVEREEGNYAIGDVASPDGKYVMEDGSTVVVADGVVSDIIAAKMELKNPVNGETISEEEAQQMLNNYEQQVNDLKAQLDAKDTEKQTETDALKEKITALETAMQTAATEHENAMAELKAQVMTDEQKQMLDIVNAAGGMTWLNVMKDTQTNAQPIVPQNPIKTPSDVTSKVGEGFLDECKKNSRVFRVSK